MYRLSSAPRVQSTFFKLLLKELPFVISIRSTKMERWTCRGPGAGKGPPKPWEKHTLPSAQR